MWLWRGIQDLGWIEPPVPSLISEVCPHRHLWVRLGEHHLWQWEGPEKLLLVTDFFPHPGFNPDLSANDHNDDIMLIRLPWKVRLSPAVQPLNLTQNQPTVGTQCLISGWGSVSSTKSTGLPLTLAHLLPLFSFPSSSLPPLSPPKSLAPKHPLVLPHSPVLSTPQLSQRTRNPAFLITLSRLLSGSHSFCPLPTQLENWP